MRKISIKLIFAITLLLTKFALSQEASLPLLHLTNGVSSFWIVGSMHVGSKVLVDNSYPKLNSVIEHSSNICFENDPSDIRSLQDTNQSIYFNPPDVSLETRLSKKTFENLKKTFINVFPSTNAYREMSPYAAAGVLESMNPYVNQNFREFKKENSLDQYIKIQTSKFNKQIHGLESNDAVKKSFASITNTEWDQYVSGYINMLNCMECSIKYFAYLEKAYTLSNDPENSYENSIYAMTYGPNVAQIFNKMLLDKRNLDITKTIAGFGKSTSKCDLVVVGAAHLGGEHGILNLLKKANYKIIEQ
ncbi:TraB/GumN family protein [Sapientia aquatica]|uniref:TraB/GumN family protein n=1 Tax=Sapientia aquatica TaxID=1549640 RepID=A0A4R5VM30_9BURK|nr:TraB/GumN family protein [Sapientia aquatica]TDK58965.1 TraB/GumN family protein [Sapientia aquatica]